MPVGTTTALALGGGLAAGQALGGGGGGSKSVSQSQSFLPAQRTALEDVLAAFTGQGRIGTGQTSFTGEQLAGFNPLQQSILSNLGAFQGLFDPDQPIPFAGESGAALTGLLSGERGAQPISVEDFIREAIVAPREQQFEQFTAPLIREEFAGPGFQSTARARAVGLAGERLQEEIGAESGATRFAAEQFNRQLQEQQAQRALQALGPALQFAGLPTALATAQLGGQQALLGFADVETRQRQAEINVEIQRFAEANRFMDPEDLSTLLALLGLGFESSTATSRTTGATQIDPFTSALLAGGGEGAGNIFQGLFT